MNITFLIGNGFDLNVGLKTGYKHFLEYYLKQTVIDEKTNCPDKAITAFKKLISADIEYWSDLEKALGEKTTLYPLNEKEELLKCKRDLDRSLKKYLKEQQERVEFSSAQNYTSDMQRSISNFPSLFKKAVKPRIDEVFSRFMGEHVNYNAISFNYTNIFDRCFLSVNERMTSYVHNGRVWYHNRGRLIHAHGTIEDSMIVGVNDESQIANTSLSLDRIVRRVLIKPTMNELSEDLRDEEALQMIRTSAIIVVFGMSMGKTDELWWKQIAQRMLSTDFCQLIIVDYMKDLDNTFVYEVEDAKEKAIERFFIAADLDANERVKIKDRVFAFYNTSLFKVDVKVKPDNTEETSDVA